MWTREKIFGCADDEFLVASTADAEIKTYEGVGEYLMSDFETFDVAQQRAKQHAEQNACEQAGVDKTADEVFKRADKLMYENKLAMKAQRTD